MPRQPRRLRPRRRPAAIYAARKLAPELVVQACRILTGGKSRPTTNAGVVRCINRLDPWQLYAVIRRDEELLPAGVAAELAHFIADRQDEITDPVVLYAAKWSVGDLIGGGPELAEKLGYDHLTSCHRTATLEAILSYVRSTAAGREILSAMLASLSRQTTPPASLEARIVTALAELLEPGAAP